ncbi:hypothetical protein NL676_026437 [Syzygium grande]|nr:hypothetical protein NL676_026437 [Syzygium grande]
MLLSPSIPSLSFSDMDEFLSESMDEVSSTMDHFSLKDPQVNNIRVIGGKRPSAVAKVEKLICKGRPDDLPSDHSFLTDYEEFVTVFEHEVSQFQDNGKAIHAYFIMERLSQSIKEEIEHVDVIQGAEKKLRQGVPCPEKDEIKMDLSMDSHYETFVNSASTSLGRMAERLDELVEFHLELIRGLNKRLLNLDEMLPKLEEAKEQAEVANQRLEEQMQPLRGPF